MLLSKLTAMDVGNIPTRKGVGLKPCCQGDVAAVPSDSQLKLAAQDVCGVMGLPCSRLVSFLVVRSMVCTAMLPTQPVGLCGAPPPAMKSDRTLQILARDIKAVCAGLPCDSRTPTQFQLCEPFLQSTPPSRGGDNATRVVCRVFQYMASDIAQKRHASLGAVWQYLGSKGFPAVLLAFWAAECDDEGVYGPGRALVRLYGEKIVPWDNPKFLLCLAQDLASACPASVKCLLVKSVLAGIHRFGLVVCVPTPSREVAHAWFVFGSAFASLVGGIKWGPQEMEPLVYSVIDVLARCAAHCGSYYGHQDVDRLLLRPLLSAVKHDDSYRGKRWLLEVGLYRLLPGASAEAEFVRSESIQWLSSRVEGGWWRMWLVMVTEVPRLQWIPELSRVGVQGLMVFLESDPAQQREMRIRNPGFLTRVQNLVRVMVPPAVGRGGLPLPDMDDLLEPFRDCLMRRLPVRALSDDERDSVAAAGLALCNVVTHPYDVASIVRRAAWPPSGMRKSIIRAVDSLIHPEVLELIHLLESASTRAPHVVAWSVNRSGWCAAVVRGGAALRPSVSVAGTGKRSRFK